MGISKELDGPFPWREAPVADYAVIGDPISHSRSPQMHNAAYQALGLTLRYTSVHVPRGEVTEALDHLKGLGYKGINVTVPHKEEVIDWLGDCDAFASRVRSVNTIRMADKFGFNTDAPAFMETLRLLNLPPGTPTLVLGAGGSSRAIATALSEDGYPLHIWNRTPGKARALVKELDLEDALAIDTPDIRGAGLIVNATSASLAGERLPINWDDAIPGAVAYDVMYGAALNSFLDEASLGGVRAVDGLALLVMQGALAFEFWVKKNAPHEVMWEAVR
jgi:shikimate dehydrogenase